MPDHLPLPRVSKSELDAARKDYVAQARAARVHALAYEVRAAGEAFRQLGRLSFQGEAITVQRRDRLGELVRVARDRYGDEPLGQLRSVQAQLFVDALGHWERTGIANEDLIELGGDFLRVATARGWLVPESNGQRSDRKSLSLSTDERLALFLTRWARLAGTEKELPRAWPLVAISARLRQPLSKLSAEDLRLVEQAARYSPEFPELLSRGLLLLKLGDREQAIAALEEHLRRFPDGPYALRARNHLVFALEKIERHGI